MSLSIITLTANAQDKVTGPWMWMITADSAGCGAAATHVDEIDVQTGGKLTEEDVAKEGISRKTLKVDFKKISLNGQKVKSQLQVATTLTRLSLKSV